MINRHTIGLEGFESSRLIDLASVRYGKPNVSKVVSDLIRQFDEVDYLRFKAKTAFLEFQHYKGLLDNLEQMKAEEQKAREAAEEVSA